MAVTRHGVVQFRLQSSSKIRANDCNPLWQEGARPLLKIPIFTSGVEVKLTGGNARAVYVLGAVGHEATG